MRPVPLLLLAAAPLAVLAWDGGPHRAITRAALDSLPATYRAAFGDHLEALAQTHCMLPDYYAAMLQSGFRAPLPAPQSLDDAVPYCLRPDREPVHSATWDRHEDLASLVFLYERILAALRSRRPAEAARYAGVLAHFLEDSLSPPHVVGQPPAIHRALERSIPPLSLSGRAPRLAAPRLIPAAEAILNRLYTAAEINRRNMPALLAAYHRKDQGAISNLCLPPARAAAEILADALFTLLSFTARYPG
jgi:hypothetical protein